jgi:hypothetical protein
MNGMQVQVVVGVWRCLVVTVPPTAHTAVLFSSRGSEFVKCDQNESMIDKAEEVSIDASMVKTTHLWRTL